MNNVLHGGTGVKPIFAYLKDAIKFYDVQKPMVAQLAFILELAVMFIGYSLASPHIQKAFVHYERIITQMQNQPATQWLNLTNVDPSVYDNMLKAMGTVMAILIPVIILSYFISLFYGTQYFFGLTDPEMPVGKRLGRYFARLPKVIVFNVMYYFLFYIGTLVVLVAAALLMLFMPLLSFATAFLPLLLMIFDTFFVFKDWLILEFNVGLAANFKKAWQLSKNNRKHVAMNMLWPLSLGWLLTALATDGSNLLLSIFITSFLQVIVHFVSQRLAVLMFIDAAQLERKDRKGSPKPGEA